MKVNKVISILEDLYFNHCITVEQESAVGIALALIKALTKVGFIKEEEDLDNPKIINN